MFKHLLAAAIATTLFAAPAVPAYAQAAATEKADAKKAKKAPKAEKTAAAKKELTPQQQKMKDCAPKWAAYKKEKHVQGKAEHNKFMSTCLKG